MSFEVVNNVGAGAWVKHGLILRPDPERYWMKSHVAVPTVEHIKGDLYRMYFCSRDAQNRSHIGYAEFDIRDPMRMLYVTPEPVLGLGELGAFDDNGVTPTWVMDVGDKKYLYYVGWNKGTTVRMHLYVGLAISADGGKSFRRQSRAPVLERIEVDPLLTATLSILKEEDVYRMWYISGDSWFERNGETIPVYNIKYAESIDAVNWDRKGRVCITYKDADEHALARPCVIKEDGVYKMWFSHKGSDYRVGYAESKDGFDWQRKDEVVGLDQTPSDFDSVMQEYAFVVVHDNTKYMFYNGDEYGKDGIGFATCTQ
jgi:hypothetical protein